jgi:hypothetical protein
MKITSLHFCRLIIHQYTSGGLAMKLNDGDVTTSAKGFSGRVTGEYSFTYKAGSL